MHHQSMSSKSSGNGSIASQGSTPTSSELNMYQQITTTTTATGGKNHPRIKYSGMKHLVPQQPQQHHQQHHQTQHSTSTELTMGDFVKYADIDDIELADGTQIGYPATNNDTAANITTKDNHTNMQSPPAPTVVALKLATSPTTPVSQNDSKTAAASPPSQSGQQQNHTGQNHDSFSMAEKYSIIAANALKNFDFSSIDLNNSLEDGDKLYSCQHCGKKYRWKSTLRRHENDECGGKEPAHQCPYCPYKAKQRGNLGVHVRKHHSEMPQLESRRKKRTTI